MRKLNSGKYTLLIAMSVSVLFAVLITLSMLYSKHYQKYKQQMTLSVEGQKQLIAAVSRLDASNSEPAHPGGNIAGTLSQIINTHRHSSQQNDSKSFLLAEIIGHSVEPVFFHSGETLSVTQRYRLMGNGVELPNWYQQIQDIALLNDSTGFVETKELLLVYSKVNISSKSFLLVEKIDLAEIRAPFINVFFIAFCIAVIVVIVIGQFINRQTGELIRNLDHQMVFNQAILQTAATPIIITDIDYRITHFNRAELLTFDYTDKEFIGTDVHQLFKVDEDDEHYEVQGNRKDSRQIWLSVSSGICPDSESPFRLFLVNDISAIRQAEEDIRDSIVKNAAVIDTVRDAIFSINTQGVIETANPAAEKMFGLFIGELEQSNIKNLIRDFSDFETPQVSLFTVGVTKSGDEFPVEISSSVYFLKDEMQVTCVVRDITERKKVEHELQQHQDQLQTLVKDATSEITAIVETAVVGIVTLDQTGTVNSFNPAAQSIFDYDSGEVVGRRFDLLIPRLGEQEGCQFIQRYLETGCTDVIGCRLEVEGIRKGEQSFPVQIAIGHKALSEDNHLFVAYISDISQAKKAQLELIEAKDKAEEAVKVKANFLANMSHEIRTPMNAIIGFAEVLCRHQSLDEPSMGHVHTIRNSAKGLLGIINDILDFSKLEASKLTLENVHFNLGNMLEECINILSIKAKESNLELKLEFDLPQPYRVVGDPARLRQVIINLTGNAIKFTKKGSVTIAVSATDGDKLLFQIRDTGIGMSEEQVARVFESFSQADGSTSRKYGGTGLGTTISKQIIEAMGGHIWIESKLGVGSTFLFELEFATSSECENVLFENERDQVEQGVSSSRAFRILLAEDIYENASLATLRLTELGHQVDWVENGLQVLEALETKPYDLILMDVMMPQMDGLEATREIRKLQCNYCDIAIVALTASVMAEDLDMCINAGINAVEGKPIDFDSLCTTMEKTVAPHLGQAINRKVPTIQKVSQGLSALDGIADTTKAIKTWQCVDTYLKAVRFFANDKRQFLAQFKQSIDNEDFVQAKALAHTLKGVSGNLQLSDVFVCAGKLDSLLSKALKSQVPHNELMLARSKLEQALELAIATIDEQLADETHSQTKQSMDLDKVSQLIARLLLEVDNLNPDLLESALESLAAYLPEDLIAPMQSSLNNFEFDDLKTQLLQVAEDYDIEYQAVRVSL